MLIAGYKFLIESQNSYKYLFEECWMVKLIVYQINKLFHFVVVRYLSCCQKSSWHIWQSVVAHTLKNNTLWDTTRRIFLHWITLWLKVFLQVSCCTKFLYFSIEILLQPSNSYILLPLYGYICIDRIYGNLKITLKTIFPIYSLLIF